MLFCFGFFCVEANDFQILFFSFKFSFESGQTIMEILVLDFCSVSYASRANLYDSFTLFLLASTSANARRDLVSSTLGFFCKI